MARPLLMVWGMNPTTTLLFALGIGLLAPGALAAPTPAPADRTEAEAPAPAPAAPPAADAAAPDGQVWSDALGIVGTTLIWTTVWAVVITLFGAAGMPIGVIIGALVGPTTFPAADTGAAVGAAVVAAGSYIAANAAVLVWAVATLVLVGTAFERWPGGFPSTGPIFTGVVVLSLVNTALVFGLPVAGAFAVPFVAGGAYAVLADGE